MEELRFEIAEDMEDERIDKCISLLVEELSRSFIQKLIKDGNVLVNGKPVKGCFAILFASSAEGLVKKGSIVYSIFIEINIKEAVL